MCVLSHTHHRAHLRTLSLTYLDTAQAILQESLLESVLLLLLGERFVVLVFSNSEILLQLEENGSSAIHKLRHRVCIHLCVYLSLLPLPFPQTHTHKRKHAQARTRAQAPCNAVSLDMPVFRVLACRIQFVVLAFSGCETLSHEDMAYEHFSVRVRTRAYLPNLSCYACPSHSHTPPACPFYIFLMNSKMTSCYFQQRHATLRDHQNQTSYQVGFNISLSVTPRAH